MYQLHPSHRCYTEKYYILYCIFFSLDDEGVVIKSTRHAQNFGNNLVNVLSPTPSTIMVHGLLGEVCIADSDCSIFNRYAYYLRFLSKFFWAYVVRFPVVSVVFPIWPNNFIRCFTASVLNFKWKLLC